VFYTVANVFAFFLFWTICGLTVLSLVPYDLRKRTGSLVLCLPLVGLAVYGLYEVAADLAIRVESIPIRIDRLLVLPCLGFITLAGVARWLILLTLKARGRFGSATGRTEQTLAVSALLLVLLVVLARFWRL